MRELWTFAHEQLTDAVRFRSYQRDGCQGFAMAAIPPAISNETSVSRSDRPHSGAASRLAAVGHESDIGAILVGSI